MSIVRQVETNVDGLLYSDSMYSMFCLLYSM